jgi:hypothetical protein
VSVTRFSIHSRFILTYNCVTFYLISMLQCFLKSLRVKKEEGLMCRSCLDILDYLLW